MKLSRDYVIIALTIVVLYLLFMRPRTSFASKSWKFNSTRCAINNDCYSVGGRCMNNGVKGKFCAVYS